MSPATHNNEEDKDKFEDAYEVIPVATTMNLLSSLEESTTGLYLFLNNKFSDAINLIYPWSHDSMYHALIYDILMVVKAILTFEPQDIHIGMTTARNALKTCNRFRGKSRLTFSSHVGFKQGIRSVREEELHAEVCYAECLILKSAVTFIQDDSMLGFLKNGINVGLSYQIYKNCQQILIQIPNHQSKAHKHLVGGIKFGLGAFNLILSLVPPRTLKLLNMVGYSGDREIGLALLHESASENHINNILSVFTLLFYYNYISIAFGIGKGYLSNSATEGLFLTNLQKFPNCVILIFFHARFRMLTGHFELAQEKLRQCIFIQNEWQQINHLCYWELMWCHIFLQQWKEAYHLARLLSEHSRWSKAISTYSQAVILAVLPSVSVSEDMNALFLKVDSLRIRIFGTSVPIEKFVAEKGERYGTTTDWFTAQPILEFLYAWSGFRVMSKRLDLVSKWLSIIDKGENMLRENPSKEYGEDDITLINLLKGLCLKHMGKYWEAEQHFNHVIQREKLLRYDRYLVPYAYYELGILHYLKRDYASALKSLDNIKNYKDYAMEARLQFRAHIAQEQITKETAA
ncbi:tetratricopeptide repeat protein 39B-like [Echinops telfairi]|uniref:Tetratricopeptide repeat protein 39B-like n=2 Tax=Echinops telfairi TaxID=9371 RepID=A0ABM0ZSJ0_ECHTE|nr:tetratricopeptide repeat protein 39B-like [Echinops telfairi]XP_045142944.1 tetratricopeptide repeat protein 39B-like [Echinops telfairi]